MMNKENTNNTRCGYVAILGRPNVGKSTLLNNILQIKLSIITPKPQTTRHRVLGIYNNDCAQIVFLDTPGIIEPRYKLQELLVRAAQSAAKEADILLFLIEADEALALQDNEIMVELSRYSKPIILCINKIDKVDKRRLLPQIASLSRIECIKEIVPASALKNDGIDVLLRTLIKHLPVSPPLYPADQLTTAPERFFVSEIIREKVFFHYGQEIPYSTTVAIEEFTERTGRKDYIRAAILVERESQKGILIGKKGEALKKVGAAARQEIETLLGRPVFLEMVVLVRPNWRQKEKTLRELGY
ncbi:MAG: GTPase Era [bacterium]